MTEIEKAVARACLDSTETNLAELRSVLPWWGARSESEKDEFKMFLAQVMKWRNDLRQ